LANDPKLILADEPTGNVDTKTSDMILKKLRLFVQERQSTMLIATHDPQVGSFADMILRMQDGKIIATDNNSSCVSQDDIVKSYSIDRLVSETYYFPAYKQSSSSLSAVETI